MIRRIWLLMLCLSLMACPMAAMAEQTQEAAEETSIADVLLHGGTACELPGSATRTLAEMLAADEGTALSRFALVDLDADGSMDVVVEITMGEYPAFYLLLKMHDDQPVMQQVSYRGLMNLKDDGSFDYANSADDGGAARYSWTEEGFVLTPLEEAEAAAHEAALDALWYDFTPEWLERILLAQTG